MRPGADGPRIIRTEVLSFGGSDVEKRILLRSGPVSRRARRGKRRSANARTRGRKGDLVRLHGVTERRIKKMDAQEG